MNARILPVACLVASLTVPELALARSQPAVAAPVATPASTAVPTTPPAAAAPAPVTADAANPTPVVVAPSVPPPVVQPVAVPPVAPQRLRGGKQMIVAGATTLGSMYFFSTLAGALAIDRGRHRKPDATGMLGAPDRRRINFGRGLLVPVAGPFIAMAYTDSALQRWGAAMTGALQVTGAVLVFAGMVRNARMHRWERVSLGAGPATGGASISISGRF